MPRHGRPIIERATVVMVMCFGTGSIGRAQTHDIDSLREAVVSGPQDVKVKASTLYKCTSKGVGSEGSDLRLRGVVNFTR